MAEVASVEKVRNAARAFRFANVVVGLAALCWIVLGMTAGRRDESATAAYVASVAVLGVVVTPLLLALVAYRLSRSIEVGSPVLWAIGSALGCVGVLVLLRLSNTASKWFSRQGVKVGLLGPTPKSLAAFEAAHGQPPSGS